MASSDGRKMSPDIPSYIDCVHIPVGAHCITTNYIYAKKKGQSGEITLTKIQANTELRKLFRCRYSPQPHKAMW